MCLRKLNLNSHQHVRSITARHIALQFMYVDRSKDTKPEHRQVFEAVDRIPFPAGWTGSLTVTVIAGKAKDFVTVREDVAPRS